MKYLRLFTVAMSFTLVLAFSSTAFSECYCACVNNKKVKVCENSWDANYVYCNGTWCSGS